MHTITLKNRNPLQLSKKDMYKEIKRIHTSGSMTSSNCGGTRMANPSPKNWNQDLVFAMPETAGFGGTEGSAEEWATGYAGVKQMMESEVVLRIKCLLEMVVKAVGLGAGREMGLVVAELRFWGGFRGCGGRERRMAMRELR